MISRGEFVPESTIQNRAYCRRTSIWTGKGTINLIFGSEFRVGHFGHLANPRVDDQCIRKCLPIGNGDARSRSPYWYGVYIVVSPGGQCRWVRKSTITPEAFRSQGNPGPWPASRRPAPGACFIGFRQARERLLVQFDPEFSTPRAKRDRPG